MRYRASPTPRRGTVLPLVALCCVALLGLVALAIDIGMIAVARSQCQNAADASAMAGARTINGNSTGNYNISAAPANAVAAAVANKVFSTNIPGSVATIKPSGATDANGNPYEYKAGNVTVEMGAYAYVYNDSAPTTEGFQLQIPQTVTTEPYSAVRTTITYQGGFNFGRVFGLNSYNTSAQAVAVHRPRDVVIIVDLSGSMRFQSLPGVPLVNGDNFGDSGTFAACSSGSNPRTMSMNPDPVFPQFGHYADVTGAALQGSQTYYATSGEYVDLSNISSSQNSGPPLVQDFYQNPPGTAPGSTNLAFNAAPSSYATAPGGDNYLSTSLDTGATYAQTVAQFNNNSSKTNTTFETQGYAAFGGRTQFYGYTQGPNYWGKTFYIWPPNPCGPNVVAPPATLTDTSFNWYDNKSLDWRQRFFVMVNTATSAPYWLNHNTVLFDNTGSGATIKRPGNTTSVTENGTSITYDIRPNYAAILYWLQQGPNPFPSTLQGGRIRYYGSMPAGTDNSLNNRWWTTDPTTLPSDERFWKEYIDFVLGYVGKGAGSYNRFQNGVPVSALIGNGDYFTWTGSTVQISARPQPQPPSSTPAAPYETDTINKGGYKKGATTVTVTGLPSLPVANRDYCIINGDTSNPYLIVGGTTSSLNLSPGLANNVPNNASVQVYSPYMDYNDNPPRPRHQYWFGPMTMVDWLGNYNLYTVNNFSAPHHWWPGNCHEAHAWACKVGIQTAINDIQNNHPSDFVGLTFFSSPNYGNADNGHHNKAAVPLGRSYQQLTDSLWFPPSTVTGSNTEIGPYDADMPQVPRSDGGTCPGMGFMIAYNQLSSSAGNLRLYAQPTPQYRGSAGGLGRKGASRMIIFETDGFPNTGATATLSGSGTDSYYPIRVNNPANMADSKNVEWPNGSGYKDSDVFAVIQQICAPTTASPPGYGTQLKPVLVQCIGYGSIFDPANTGNSQTKALTFLQSVRYYGNTASDTNPANFPAWAQIYGTPNQRITSMQQAFTNIMQSGVQVSLIQ